MPPKKRQASKRGGGGGGTTNKGTSTKRGQTPKPEPLPDLAQFLIDTLDLPDVTDILAAGAFKEASQEFSNIAQYREQLKETLAPCYGKRKMPRTPRKLAHKQPTQPIPVASRVLDFGIDADEEKNQTAESDIISAIGKVPQTPGHQLHELVSTLNLADNSRASGATPSPSQRPIPANAIIDATAFMQATNATSTPKVPETAAMVAPISSNASAADVTTATKLPTSEITATEITQSLPAQHAIMQVDTAISPSISKGAPSAANSTSHESIPAVVTEIVPTLGPITRSATSSPSNSRPMAHASASIAAVSRLAPVAQSPRTPRTALSSSRYLDRTQTSRPLVTSDESAKKIRELNEKLEQAEERRKKHFREQQEQIARNLDLHQRRVNQNLMAKQLEEERKKAQLHEQQERIRQFEESQRLPKTPARLAPPSTVVTPRQQSVPPKRQKPDESAKTMQMALKTVGPHVSKLPVPKSRQLTAKPPAKRVEPPGVSGHRANASTIEKSTDDRKQKSLDADHHVYAEPATQEANQHEVLPEVAIPANDVAQAIYRETVEEPPTREAPPTAETDKGARKKKSSDIEIIRVVGPIAEKENEQPPAPPRPRPISAPAVVAVPKQKKVQVKVEPVTPPEKRITPPGNDYCGPESNTPDVEMADPVAEKENEPEVPAAVAPPLNVTQTKPRENTYAMTPEKVFQPSTENDYNVNDLSSNDETDDEENPRKRVPKWADKEKLRAHLKKLFREVSKDAIRVHFGVIKQPQAALLFAEANKSYGSAINDTSQWTSPVTK